MSEFFSKTKKGWLIFIDILLLYLALWLMLKLRFGEGWNLMWAKHFFAFSTIFPLWLITFYIFGLYDLSFAKNAPSFYFAILKGTLLNGLVSTTLFYLFPNFLGVTPKTNLFLTLLFFGILLFLWRYLYNLMIKSTGFARDIVIIGKNPQTLELTEKINSNPQLGYRVVSLIDPEKDELTLDRGIYTMVVAVKLTSHPELAKKLYKYLPHCDFENFPDFYEKITGKIPLSQIDEFWFLNNLKERGKETYEKLKRLIDILIGAAIGAITITVFPLVALTIKLDSPGPVFYKQTRIGKNGKELKLIKFRSMRKDAEKNGAIWAKKNDSRITRAGRILRKSLIDELPQFINILRGEISFIGPRPERPEFVTQLAKEIPFYQNRHIIKPGLSGWAQINFKYGNTKQDALEKLQYELYYIKNRSLFLDLKVILKTIDILFRGGTL